MVYYFEEGIGRLPRPSSSGSQWPCK